MGLKLDPLREGRSEQMLDVCGAADCRRQGKHCDQAMRGAQFRRKMHRVALLCSGKLNLGLALGGILSSRVLPHAALARLRSLCKQVALEWCTVGGSAGSRSTEHHKKLQIWRPETKEIAIENAMESLLRRGKEIPKDFEKNFNFSNAWAPGGSRRASDGLSIESGSMVFCRKVDTFAPWHTWILTCPCYGMP